MEPGKRREVLINRMNELESMGMSCMGCHGNCCTFEANSMMLTPLETVELILFLKSSQQLDDELKERCKETVQKFRLDHQFGNGRKSFLRRTYTCPFFHHKELGCPLPREVKPFGCLAFNAHHAEVKAQEHCYSETDLMIKRESLFPEEEKINLHLKQKYNIFWDKSPLPLALLEVWDLDFKASDLLLD